MTFILPGPQVPNQPLRITPRCAQKASLSNTSRALRVAVAGAAAAGLITGLQVVDAIELPQLPIPSLPSVSLPGLPGFPKFGGEQPPKDSPTDLSKEEEGRVDDMMTKLQEKKKSRTAKL